LLAAKNNPAFLKLKGDRGHMGDETNPFDKLASRSLLSDPDICPSFGYIMERDYEIQN